MNIDCGSRMALEGNATKQVESFPSLCRRLLRGRSWMQEGLRLDEVHVTFNFRLHKVSKKHGT